MTTAKLGNFLHNNIYCYLALLDLLPLVVNVIKADLESCFTVRNRDQHFKNKAHYMFRNLNWISTSTCSNCF